MEISKIAYRYAEIGNNQVYIANGSIDSIEDNTVLIKMLYTGICRADIKEINRPKPTDKNIISIFGHELIGEIIQAGIDTEFRKNTIVTLNPNIPLKRSTGFGELMKIQGNKKDLLEALITINDINPHIHYVFMEPLSCILHSLNAFKNNSGIQSFTGLKCAILGAGNAGLLFGMLLKQSGADICIYNRNSQRIQFVLDRSLFSENEIKPLNSTHKKKQFYDIIIIATSTITDKTFSTACELGVNNGYIHLYGGTPQGSLITDSIDLYDIREKELTTTVNLHGFKYTISGAKGCMHENLVNSLKLLSSQPVKNQLDKMISEIILFDDFPEVATGMAAGTIDCPGKVIVKY